MPEYEATFKVRFKADNLADAQGVVEALHTGVPGTWAGLPAQLYLGRRSSELFANLNWERWNNPISIVNNK